MRYKQNRDSWGIGLGTAGQAIGAFGYSDANLKTIYRDDLKIDWL